MLDCYASLNILENEYREAYTNFVSANFADYCLFERIMGFQKNLLVEIKRTDNQLSSSDPVTRLYNLCYFNVGHLYSAVRALGSQNLPTCFALVRIIFESFPKLFYCMYEQEKINQIFCCEEYDYQKITRKENSVINEFCKQFKETISEDLKQNFKQAEWYRKKIYDKTSLSKINKAYGVYSVNSHPSFEPIHVANNQDVKESWEAGLEILNAFSLLNLFILTNILSPQLEIIHKYDDAKKLIQNTIHSSKKIHDTVQLLYPDKQEFTKKLSFRL